LCGLRRAPEARDRAPAPRGGDGAARRFRLQGRSRAVERGTRETRADPADRYRPGFANCRHDAGGDLPATDSPEAAAAPERLTDPKLGLPGAAGRRRNSTDGDEMKRLVSLCCALA